MLFIPPCAQALRAVKSAVSGSLPSVPSSHLSEALAAATGHNTNAALRASLWSTERDAATLSALEFSDDLFVTRLKQLGHTVDPTWQGFDALARKAWVSRQYRSRRQLAARNVMVAAVMSGIAQGLFTLDEDGNHWPGADQRSGSLFHVWMPHRIPALAYVSDIGMGELAVHVACWPKGTLVRASNAGFCAGDAMVVGWIERKTGKWIMDDHRGGLTANIRNQYLDLLAGSIAPASGFADQGKFIA